MTLKRTVATVEAEVYEAIPRDEADLILESGLRLGRAARYAHPEADVADDDARTIEAWVDRRRDGEPIAYILGKTHFLGVELAVDRRVLIPRLDTEVLVAAALNAPGKRVLDIGTGSGAVAIALATNDPTREVIASDIDADAIAVASANVNRHQLPVECVQANLADAFARCFDLVVSNPPYIEADDPHLGQGDLRYEPKRALVGGKAMLAALVRSAAQSLVQGGRLLIEHGYDQGEYARALLHEHGFRDVATLHDFEHRERVTGGTR